MVFTALIDGRKLFPLQTEGMQVYMLHTAVLARD